MNQRLIPYSWDILRISRDVFEIKFSNLYARKNKEGIIQISYWDAYIYVWYFEKGIFVPSPFFNMKILEELNNKLKRFDITIDINIREDVAEIINKLSK